METIGFVGVGKVGLPICRHLIKAGHRVLGYRRNIRALAEFEKAGGIAAKSSADATANSDLVFTCLPSDEALEEVVNGPHGIAQAAKPGQIVVEFGSHAVPVKKDTSLLWRRRAPFSSTARSAERPGWSRPARG